MQETNRIGFISCSNKERGKKIPLKMHIRTKPREKEKESDLLTSCRHVLHLLTCIGEVSYRRIHVMPVMRGGFMSINREMSGMEDLQIYLKGGKFWAVELKSKKGKQSENQIARQKELLTVGHDYSVIRDLDELLNGLFERGVNLKLIFKGEKWLSSKNK